MVAICGGGCGGGGSGGYAGPGADAGSGDAHTGDGGSSSGGDATFASLTISPTNPTLAVTAPGATLQFQALEGATPVTAQWTIDVADIGTIDGTGLFTASGLVGGPTTVTAASGNLSAKTLLTVNLTVTDNPGNVPAGTQTQLEGGGSADPTFKWLYPYDATIFARGTGAPVLQTAGAYDAAYLHVTCAGLDYKGFFGASNPGRITLAPQVWQMITETAQANVPVKVQITEISGGKVTGPITETWTVAQANLRGTIYYNSYNSKLAGTGSVLSLRPGQTPKVVVQDANCKVCHAVSADGSTRSWQPTRTRRRGRGRTTCGASRTRRRPSTAGRTASGCSARSRRTARRDSSTTARRPTRRIPTRRGRPTCAAWASRATSRPPSTTPRRGQPSRRRASRPPRT